MTLFLLVRHATTDSVGRTLAGRTPRIPLDETGRRQAERLALWFRPRPVERVYSSPLERARETANAIAGALGIDSAVAPEIGEIDFGGWTGRTFEELASRADWRQFNTFRSGTRPPGGETMAEAQVRVTGFMQRIQEEFPDDRVALVSHGDVIKSALCWSLGVPLDLCQRIEISPASVTAIRLFNTGPQVQFVNLTPWDNARD